MKTKYRQSVCAILTLNNRFVGIRPKKFDYQATLPGGKVEKGESLTDAAIREIYEETGLVITQLTPFYSGLIGWNDFISTAFVAKAFGELRSSDEGEATLVTREDLLEGPYKDYYKNMFESYDGLP